MTFLGGIAKTAVGVAPYVGQVVRANHDQELKDALMKAQTASLSTKAGAKKVIFDRDGNPWAQDPDGTISRAEVHDGAPQAPAAPAPASPSFDGPTDKDWTQSLRRIPSSQGVAPQQSMPPVGVTPSAPPQQQAPPVVRQLPKFGKPPVAPKLDGNDPQVAAAKAAAVATAKQPSQAAAAKLAITTDSTKAANRSAIANSPAAITADSTKKANAQNIRVLNPLPSKAGAGRTDPYSKEAITADSLKAANRALSKPGGMTGGMGSGGIGGIARTDGAITELRQAHNMMLPYEAAVKSGKATYDGLDYFGGMLSKMYDAHGITDKAAHAAAFAHLNQVNPPLANYLRAAEMWSLADGGVSGKTSDFRTKMDAFVSSVGPRAGAQGIDQVQLGRSTRLEALEKYQPAMRSIADRFTGGGKGGGRAATPGTPARGNDAGGNVNLGGASPLRQKYDAAVAHLKSQGMKDADIVAKIGGPPGTE